MLHELVSYMGALIVLVCWILVLAGDIHLLGFVHLVLICRMHPNICKEPFHFFCILILLLDVWRCNLKCIYLFCCFDYCFVCATTSECSAINIVGSIALAQYINVWTVFRCRF